MDENLLLEADGFVEVIDDDLIWAASGSFHFSQYSTTVKSGRGERFVLHRPQDEKNNRRDPQERENHLLDDFHRKTTRLYPPPTVDAELPSTTSIVA